jgi:hypothetical protein
MPYVVTEVKAPGKRKTIYTISNSHDNSAVGKVIIHGRRRHWAFTSVTGTTIPLRTHARMINGMRDAVMTYCRSPYPPLSNLDNILKDWGMMDETRPDITTVD